MRIFAQITKVDATKREVWGRAVEEIPDNAGEIFDYATSKPFFQKWSDEFAKATDGKSLGNVRAMHGNVAAGKLIAFLPEDAKKAIDIGTKIVDEQEWNKVEEGVYTGFSIGGKYVKKWKDGELVRYTANPSEVSLVDKPCVPTAQFEMIKSDGSTLMKNFRPAIDVLADLLNTGKVTPEQLVKMVQKDDDGEDDEDEYEKPDGVSQEAWDAMDAEERRACVEDGECDKTDFDKLTPDQQNARVEKAARALATAAFAKLAPEMQAGRDPDGDWKNHVAEALRTCRKREFTQEQRDDAADSGAALPDGSFPIKNKEDLKNAIQAYGRAKDKAKAKAHIIARAKALGATDLLPEGWGGDDSSDKMDWGTLRKGLPNVGRFADALMALSYVCYSAQQDYDTEGDNSPVPGQMKKWIAAGVEIFKGMAEEEADELVASLQTQGNAAVLAMVERVKMGKVLEDVAAGGDELKKAVTHFLGNVEKSAKTLAQLREEALAKYGARHSKEDSDRLQMIHDSSVGMGAKCDMASEKNEPAQPGGAPATPEKVDSGTLLKLEVAEKQINKLEGQLKELAEAGVLLAKEVARLRDSPVPAKGRLRAVSKEGDVINATDGTTEIEKKDDDVTSGTHNPERALALIKSELVRKGFRKG